jgi:hypothetical protein
MKLSKNALLEIVAIVQDGLMNGKDISQALRDLDFVEQKGAILSQTDDIGKLTLSPDYLSVHPRAGTWVEPASTENN